MSEVPFVPNFEKISEMSFVVKGRVEGNRLDCYLGKRFSDYSRSFLQKLIKDGCVLVDGKVAKASNKIRMGQEISIKLPELTPLHLQPEEMPLDILYEDEYLAIINKPSNLVIHPSKGHLKGTLVNGLLAYFGDLSDCNDMYRPGIVHRLDKNTTGVLLIAKNNQAHALLSQQFEKREIQKEYIALVEGEMRFWEGSIEMPLGMDPKNRERMTVCHGGKPAITDYQVIAKYPKFSLVLAKPKTGRTHQIRVHLKSQGHPLVGDDLYGGSKELTTDKIFALFDSNINKVESSEILIQRQALHAWRLTFCHPVTKMVMTFVAPLAEDIKNTLSVFQSVWPNSEVQKILFS